ncbi:hypothetical protein [Streptomyces sp. NPDC001380]|uniref:hypothetical protein n=1 Tax=Streptomyces sp. NPDC001380 TaxID=3364566 RepID=UPI003677F7DD
MTTSQVSSNSPSVPAQGKLSQPQTIKLILDRSQRPTRTVPIRRTFLQQGASTGPKTPGPLHELVRRSQKRAFDLYILVSAVTSGGDFSVTEWSTTWARSVGIFDETSGTAAVSRAWKVLEELNLISRKRGKGGKTVITKLNEDGSGSPYSPPAGGEPYFQLPFDYWDNNWHNTLSLPGKAMLLVASSQRKTDFTLPQERMPKWYGISPDTAGKGIRELINNNILVHTGDEWYDTLSTRSGRASRPLYALWPPFSPRGLGTPTPDTEAGVVTTSGS